MTAAPSVEAVLEEAQDLGFLGPGPVDDHLRHAIALAHLIEPIEQDWLDLGSGGGVPGLVWLTTYPAGSATLVDASARRCAFLRNAVGTLGLGDRAQVVEGRAEVLARHPELRERFPLVVARSFGAPAVTAECAAGFLTPGGRLVVSEPPSGVAITAGAGEATTSRWPSEGLARLVFSTAEVRRGGDVGAAVMQRTGPVDERWPRRNGVPAKRPLW